MDPANVWKEPFSSDFQVWHHQDAAWQMPRFHYHDVYEIYLSMSDHGRYFVGDQIYEFRQGDVFVFNDLDIHRSVPASGRSYERYILVFQPSFAAGLSTEATDLLACFRHRPAGFSHCFHPDPAEWSRLTELFESGISLCQEPSGSFGADIRKRLCLGGILLQLAIAQERAASGGQELPFVHPCANRLDQRIRPVLSYIRQNLADDLSLDALSGHFFLSKHHLNALFRQATGFSINEYIISCRLNRARELLARNMPVSRVAEAVGYTSVAHFIRIFRVRFGQPPGKYSRMKS